jgi:hypothetical protein
MRQTMKECMGRQKKRTCFRKYVLFFFCLPSHFFTPFLYLFNTCNFLILSHPSDDAERYSLKVWGFFVNHFWIKFEIYFITVQYFVFQYQYLSIIELIYKCFFLEHGWWCNSSTWTWCSTLGKYYTKNCFILFRLSTTITR